MGLASSTPTLSARVPDGWWMSHKRYRYYMFFAMASGVLSLASIVLLLAVRALAQGSQAWTGFQAMLGSPAGLLLSAGILVPTCFFSLRWLRLGVKIPQVKLGPMPALGPGLLYVVHFGGLVALSLLVLLLLSGVVV